MPSPKALVVEDAEEFVRMARRILEQEGFEVHVATSGERALGMARDQDFELVLIDVALPGMDGFDVCQQLRGFSDAYVLMVTGRTAEVEKIVGFRVGADDYVTKPYSPAELSARIAAMRRRPRQARAAGARAFGRMELDPQSREVTVDGGQVAMTRIEFDLLHVLSETPRRVFSRVQLLETIWGHAQGDAHVVDVHIGNLRRKLRQALGEEDPIRTVRGVGYKFDPVT
ncbi:response regulator transcription factor [Nocardioides dongkuii]|uniref:response regulator transcription factor n=1 Tax=Nocardioides dongkuii TaxID=2760089 RepID=UPI0015FD8FEE|nr:response regulator transcription factor [Nocardioides dongkuii]